MKEKCGVAGICSRKSMNILSTLVIALRALQHRGQEAWGIAVPGHEPFKKRGLVSGESAVLTEVVQEYASPVAIGHTRYSTAGENSIENAQPLMINGAFSVAHNGTISNIDELFQRVYGESRVPPGVNDTRLAAERLRSMLSQHDGDWFTAFEDFAKELDGSYCFVFLTSSGEVYAARDGKGFRPLCLGWHEETESHVVVSESCALSVIGAKLIRDVRPGEIVRIDGEGIESRFFASGSTPAHCPFEYTYFAHPISVIEGVNVYEARKRIGRLLAKKYPVEGDVVIPVPDSARPAALGYSEASGIPFEEGLMKDRYSRKGGLRSFIEPENREREEIARWVVAVEPIVRGKRVVVVDDSVVRGTSSMWIAKALKAAGARTVSLLLTFPPIRAPCYMGIDFPSREELLAFRVAAQETGIEEVNERVAEAIGVNFVGYNDFETLAKGIGIPESLLCRSCTTGDYSCLKKPPVFKTRHQMKG